MQAALLPSRGVVALDGGDAVPFLNGLVTSDLTRLAVSEARFAALLTPQGKIVADFLVVRTADGVLLDTPRELASPLATKLSFYKLRANVTVRNLSDQYGVMAFWGGENAANASYSDPRDADLGYRAIGTHADLEAIASGAQAVSETDYDAHRIRHGVPQGGADFTYGDAFPHEANMDKLRGVDFDKGCYIGQEVVSRMHHRGTARTRIVRVDYGGDAPRQGEAVMAGDKSIGTMGSSAGGRGLTLLRLDRALEALDAGATLSAGGVALRIADGAALALPPKHSVA